MAYPVCPSGWSKIGSCADSYHCDTTPCGSSTQKWTDKYVKCVLNTVNCNQFPNNPGCVDCFWYDSTYDGCC